MDWASQLGTTRRSGEIDRFQCMAYCPSTK
jgi:hypothetical protein